MKRIKFSRNCHARMLFALLIVVAAERTKADDQKEYPPRGAIGVGTSTSCGKWLQYRSNGDKSAQWQLESWIAGFISGVNLYDTNQPDVISSCPTIKPVDTTAWYAWIDNWCRQHALDSLVIATGALRAELIKRMRQ